MSKAKIANRERGNYEVYLWICKIIRNHSSKLSQEWLSIFEEI
jgi:hypothetical protein